MRLLGFFILALRCYGSIATIYYAPASAGSNNGTDCANAYVYSDATNGFSVSGKWGAGSTQIGQDTTVHFCGGTYTGSLNSTLLTFQGNGASGHPITMVIDAAATLTSPAWNGSNGAINTNSHTFLVLNGTNGTITNSANGDGLANQQISRMISANGCSGCTIENWTITNNYVAIQNFGSPLGGTATQMNAIAFNGQNVVVSGNTISDCGWCLYDSYAASDTNHQVFNNTVTNWDHAMMFATGGANACSAPCLFFHDNNIGSNVNWETSGCVYHLDGLHAFGTTGSTMNGQYIYNNWFHGTLAGACSSGFLFSETGTSQAGASNTYVWNNVFDASQADSANANGWIGWFSGAGGTTQFYNNYVSGPQVSDATVCWNIAVQSTTTLLIENNVVRKCSQGPNLSYGSGTYTIDYNLYVTPCAASNNCFVWNPGNTGSVFEGSFSAWKTACSCDSHSITTASDAAADLNSGGMPTTGSPAISAGLNLTSTATGNLATLSSDSAANHTPVARPTSAAWDIGAYQYIPPPTGTSLGATISIGGNTARQ